MKISTPTSLLRALLLCASAKRATALGVVILIFIGNTLLAQDGVRIAATTGTADPSALLDVVSTAKGVLIPRMTASQRTGIASPATGLLVYQTDGTPGFYYNAGTPGAPNWVILSAGALSGVGVTNYAARWTTPSLLGTGAIYDNGSSVGIGTASPAVKLHVAGGGMVLGTTSTGSNLRTLTVLNDGQAQINFGSYPYDWSPAIQLQNNDNSKFTWISAGGSGAYSVYNARYYTSGSGLEFYVGSNSFSTILTSGGSVGIGVASPAEKLQVAGKIKADQLDIAVGATIHICFTHCGGACGSYHNINVWTNISAIGYNWTTTYNNAPDVFTHNNFGTITVHKTGTYSIKLYSMAIPGQTVGWVEALIPVVNGGIDGTPGSADIQYNHRYCQAGYWNQDIAEFRRNLNAGSTVQYAYHNYVPLSYWAHDWYTAMEITRIN